MQSRKECKYLGSSDVVIQHYRLEHLPGILKLYNSTLAGSVHFLRNQDFLKYMIQHPEVKEDSIFVAITNNEITGFAILSISDEYSKIGSIIEFQAKDSLSMIALVQSAEQYCTDNDVDRLVVVPPPSLPKCSIFKEWTRIQTGTGRLVVKTVSFVSLFRSVFCKNELKKSFSGKIIVFNIGDEIINIKVTPDDVQINENDFASERNAIRIVLSTKLFVKIIFCQANLLFALLTGRIRVNGMQKIPLTLKLLNMLKLTDPVYMSMADRI